MKYNQRELRYIYGLYNDIDRTLYSYNDRKDSESYNQLLILYTKLHKYLWKNNQTGTLKVLYIPFIITP